MQPERFTHQPLHPIAYIRFADLARHGDAQSSWATPITAAVHHEMLRSHSASTSLYREVFPATTNADALRKAFVRGTDHLR
jgi:hypothetical protein